MLKETLDDPVPTLALTDTCDSSQVSDMKSNNNALLILLAPGEASRHMRMVLAKAFRTCRDTPDEEAHDKIVSLTEQEIELVRSQAGVDSQSDEDRRVELLMAKVVSGRMESILTEFTLRLMDKTKESPLEVLSSLVEEWTPEWIKDVEIESNNTSTAS